jgi:arsenate reductase
LADMHRMLCHRISIATNLPIGELDKLALQRELDRIGRSAAASTEKA